MDEYIPQLTLTPDLSAQAQPEVKKEEDLITKAQAAPEAGPDLSALSPAEQQAVLSFAKQIDLENAQQVLEYGASAQKNIADFSDTALAKVKTGDLGEIGTMLSGLLVELKTLEEPERRASRACSARQRSIPRSSRPASLRPRSTSTASPGSWKSTRSRF